MSILTYTKPTPRPYQIEARDNYLHGEHRDAIVNLATGLGKCLGKGTPVLMFDGSVKAVEDVAVGELLMGPDSTPRRVVSLARGQEMLYRVTPKKGMPFVVNESHILSLKLTGTDEVTNISVRDYLKRHKTYKHIMKGWRTGVDFAEKPLPIDPYFLGVWLADGCSSQPTIHKPDIEIQQLCEDVASKFDMKVHNVAAPNKCPAWSITRTTQKTNPITAILRQLNLLNNKHIPDVYKINSREVRLQLLAGIIDGDGSLSGGCYDFISKSQSIANDVAYISRSLGFAANVVECKKRCQNDYEGTYHRVCISGELSEIPCRIPRKKSPPRKQKKSVLLFGFSIEPIGVGDYYGFTIEGTDRLFLLGDFTVTHNTITSALIFDQSPGRCLFLAHTDELVRQTCRAMLRMGLWPRVEKADEYRGGHYVPDARERKMLFGDSFPPNEWFVFDKIVVSSMQTFSTRIEKYTKDPELMFDLLCIDECHRCLCKTYQNIVAAFKEANPLLRLLGLTATPYRGDKKNLGEMFPAFAFRKPIIDATEDGYLVEVRGVQGTMHDNASGLALGATDMGKDFTRSSLVKSVDSTECIQSIAHEIIERGEDRKGIVFLPGIEASEAVADALNSLKPGYASFVHGKVKKGERKYRVRAFEDNQYRVLTGCDVFTEGFDVPDVSLVVMARRTQSIGRYEQMLGRGLRPLASAIAGKETPEERRAAIAKSAKPDCLVLDFANTTKFKLVNALDVLLTGVDAKKSEYIRTRFAQKTDADRRAIREQLAEMDALYALAEALRQTGGPPPKLNYTYTSVNVYGAGGDKFKPVKNPNKLPTANMYLEADQLLLKPEQVNKLNAQELSNLIESRKNQVCGKKNYGFLIGNGINKDQIKAHKINWHDAQYLRRLVKAQRHMPSNWLQLLHKNRKQRTASE